METYNKTKLDNGLIVASEFVANVRSFAAGVCVNVGSRNDDEKKGIAHFMEHCAFRRTTTRNSKQIAHGFENIGAYSNAWTTKDTTCYYVRASEHNFDKSFELLADISQNTRFVEREIDKEKNIIIEEIRSYLDDPEEYIFDLIDKLVFANTSLSHPIVGTIKSVSSITIDDLQIFHHRFYIPSNMLVTVAGNIEHQKIVDLASKLFDKKVKTALIPSPFPTNKSVDAVKRSNLFISKPIHQAHIIMGGLTEGFAAPEERYKLSIANTIFGDGMSSRLYQRLREKYAMAYSIYSSIQNYNDCGQINIYAATDKKNIERITELIYKEMRMISGPNGPKLKELNRAKEQLKAATMIEMESMSSRMQNIIKQELGLGYNEDIHSIIKNIENVRIDDVIEMYEKYFNKNIWYKCVLVPRRLKKVPEDVEKVPEKVELIPEDVGSISKSVKLISEKIKKLF
jgi:predicted Zn-dependent peptidase